MTTPEGQPSPVRLVIDGPIEHADIVGLCDRVRLLLERDRANVVVCDVGLLRDAGLGTVALLARLQLTARRSGGRVQVRNASSGLHEVLALVGVCDVVGVCPPLRLEARGQTEHREETSGIEEEGDSGDPIA
jgi:ABC-type transporter Mla MlaB component